VKGSQLGSQATLKTLLAEPRFRLEPIHAPEYLVERSIRWVTVTELEDPAPYLLGDELILTLGSAWPDPDDPRIERFIQRLASVGVSALGLGLGIHHDQVPPTMIDAASQHGLPLIAVPLATSFRSIGEYIVDYTLGDKYAAVQSTLQAHIDLTEALTSRLGMDGLLSRLRRLLEVPVAVIDYWGNTIAAQPSSARWPTAAILAQRNTLVGEEQIEGTTVYPVTIADRRAAFLCTEGVGQAPEIMRFAVSLVALELARRQAEQHGRRELIGQVVLDYVQGDLADDEARRRLTRAGLDLERPVRVVLAQVDCPPRILEDVPWNADTLVPGDATGYLVALVEGAVAVLCGEDVPVDELTERLHLRLDRLGTTRVGVGNAYAGVTGLRLSWLGAQGAMQAAGATRAGVTMHLPKLMLANMRVPLHDVGEQILRVLMEHDRENDAHLLETLRVYLEVDCQTTEAAKALFVHPNTLRYRLRLIERLTSTDLGSFEDLVNFYLAIRALDTP
jgi:PucR family transcriptional regulator, purine catabolism regulatory protein